MRIYNEITRSGILYYGKNIEDSDLSKRYVVSQVFHYLSSTHGDIYTGRPRKRGLRKLGNFYVISGNKILVAIDVPEYYK